MEKVTIEISNLSKGQAKAIEMQINQKIQGEESSNLLELIKHLPFSKIQSRTLTQIPQFHKIDSTSTQTNGELENFVKRIPSPVMTAIKKQTEKQTGELVKQYIEENNLLFPTIVKCDIEGSEYEFIESLSDNFFSQIAISVCFTLPTSIEIFSSIDFNSTIMFATEAGARRTPVNGAF